MTVLARQKQTVNELERYSVVYTGYLDPTGNFGAGEEPVSAVITVTPVTSPVLVIGAVTIEADRVVYDVSKGLADTEYTIDIVMTTTDGRIREDCVVQQIEGAC